MPPFPYYDAAELDALDKDAAAMLGVFTKAGYARAEPSVLQPAEIFLDRSGEEIRRRTFTLTDLSGREMCLRPDLTIPICSEAAARGGPFPARICYHGPVFRHQPGKPGRPTQFVQTGAELLGLADAAAGEKEMLSLTFAALKAAGLQGSALLFGDLSLFGALVDGLALPKHWRWRLKRNFWRAGYVEALLEKLAQGTSVVEIAVLDEKADAPLAGRTREEILRRAQDKAAEAASLKLDPAIAGAITKLLRVSGPAKDAMAEIQSLLKMAGIKLDAQMAGMESRLAAMAALGVDPARIRFTAHFGRNMEYYTGFVFEVWNRDAEGPVQVAGGGRYDTLMESLGAKAPVGAIGCAIRTERVLAAKRAAS